jgi:hypothetical protein
MTIPDPTHIKSTWEAKVFPTCIEATAGEGGPAPPTGPQLIQSWPVENQNDIGSYGVQASMQAAYHAFTPSEDFQITSAKVSLKNVSGFVGPVTLNIYLATGVIPDAKPIGSAIMTSSNIDSAGVTSDPNGALYEATFVMLPANRQLRAGVTYCLTVQSASVPAAPSALMVGFTFDFTNGAQAGNGGYKDASGWGTDNACDMVFYLYGDRT